MNRRRLLAIRQTCALMTAFALLLSPARDGPTRPRHQSAEACSKGRPATSASRIDEAYTAKIQEYTTEKYFLTELVDHLPASDKVPSPDKVLGYVIGTPDKLTYTKDQYRYYRELEKSTPGYASLPRPSAARKAKNNTRSGQR